MTYRLEIDPKNVEVGQKIKLRFFKWLHLSEFSWRAGANDIRAAKERGIARQFRKVHGREYVTFANHRTTRQFMAEGKTLVWKEEAKSNPIKKPVLTVYHPSTATIERIRANAKGKKKPAINLPSKKFRR